ncbi:MAG: hypothetical protein AB7K09_09005 [Planctomycetota bacterium]
MSFNFFEYRLAFHGPLRVGDEHHEAACAWPRLHSDLVYRALAGAWRELQPDGQAAPPGWPEKPQLRVSSALPWVASPGALAPSADGQLLELAAPGKGPVDAAAISSAWSVSRRARASFNRRSARRDERFAVSEVRFADNAGLWLGVRFDSPALRAPFEAVLHYLGDCGIGGGRSTGAGTFRVVGTHEHTATADTTAAGTLWCLSRFRPSEAEYADGKLLQPPARATFSPWPVPGTGSDLGYLGEGTLLAPHPGLNALAAGTVMHVDLPGRAEKSARAGFLFAVPAPVS